MIIAIWTDMSYLPIFLTPGLTRQIGISLDDWLDLIITISDRTGYLIRRLTLELKI